MANVLVVEDEPLLRETIVDMIKITTSKLVPALEEILEANNGQEALEVFRTNKDKISIIFTDINMNPVDGYELVRILREKENYKGIVFYMSACSASDCEKAEMTYRIDKPVGIKTIKEMLLKIGFSYAPV